MTMRMPSLSDSSRKIGNAGDRFVVDQLGNLFDQTRFIDVVGNLIDDEPLPVWLLPCSSTRITPRKITLPRPVW